MSERVLRRTMSPQQGRFPRAAYLHVPFCVHRCGYCDFTVVADRSDLVTRYLAAIDAELATIGGPHPCDTIFIGGGTPTYLEPAPLTRLLQATRGSFPISATGEWSVEANPFGLTDERLYVLADHGVNRVSLGVQSFDSGVLKTLERDHTPAAARAAVERARAVFHNTSLDLIFGVPGQTLASWRETLEIAIDLGVPHVSCYGLTIEKGTSFWTRRSKGDLVESDDELQREMYAVAMDRLPAAGLEQYEISNYARPGFECAHNENYWLGGDFFGVGPGAAALVNGVRRTNHRSTTTWMKRLECHQSPVMDEEAFDPRIRGEELVMTALRRRDGLPLKLFEAEVGTSLETFAPGAIDRCVTAGWLEVNESAARLTREGRFVADTVISEFFG